ncbi:M48 family metallopeptidase [Sedimentibacter sp. zth1]|uniref:M48 family metallopeptidase n=1 Tax=Sedimentibacter sp. zth1 TaxID=2816908 RepID=UPI001A9187A2|nr:M48 family metallopeptidase [Sedimentibacter sp. zth1]QSX06617.1 M48 family metallopeptidase [Sedimentibacter sp. zth1]
MQKYDYTLIRSNRKTIELSINKSLEIIVRAPIIMSTMDIEKFVLKNNKWIEKHLVIMKNKISKNDFKELTTEEILKLKLLAKKIIPKKVEYFSKMMNVNPTGIKITSAKTRWGSCSYKNSLCFSYRLANMPNEFIDYVVVHELAHIKIKNHSKIFYKEIEKYMPDYKERIKMINIH